MTEKEVDGINEQRFELLQKRVTDSIQGECRVLFSANAFDEEGLVIDNLDWIAVEGPTQSFDEVSKTYRGPVIDNPTWLQLAIEANNMIIAADDNHHINFEGIECTGEDGNGVEVLSLWLGS